MKYAFIQRNKLVKDICSPGAERSEVARLITGTRWFGPLFFGLKSHPAKTPASPRSK